MASVSTEGHLFTVDKVLQYLERLQNRSFGRKNIINL